MLLNISWGTLSLVSSSYLVTASSYNFVTSHCDSLFVLKSLSDVLNYACTLVHSLGIYKLGKTFKMKICSFKLKFYLYIYLPFSSTFSMRITLRSISCSGVSCSKFQAGPRGKLFMNRFIQKMNAASCTQLELKSVSVQFLQKLYSRNSIKLILTDTKAQSDSQ